MGSVLFNGLQRTVTVSFSSIKKFDVKGENRLAKISDLNTSNDELAQDLILPLIERSPDIARRVAGLRPFSRSKDLAEAIRSELLALNEDQRVQLFLAHPELAPDNPLTMTEASQSEQSRLKLTDKTNGYKTRISEMNNAYRERFGFPFITAVFRHEDMASLISEFERRLTGERSAEIESALAEIIAITRSRVDKSFSNREE